MPWRLIVVLFFLLMAAPTKAAAGLPFNAEGWLTAKDMLPLCKSEHAAKRHGPCTGYIAAIYDEMKSRSLRR